MSKHLFLSLTLAAGCWTPALAQDAAPGLWEISMESRVAADAGWTPSPMSITQCLTAADARDPARLVRSIAVPGATDCKYTESSYAGNTFRFSVECSGTFAIKSRGSVGFSSDRFDGSFVSTANVVAGQATEFQNKVSGRRLGGC